MNALNIILILAVLGLGFWVWRLRGKVKKLEGEEVGSFEEKGLGKVNWERSKAKERGKETVLEYLNKNGRITNDEAEELLGISDASATRYLDELEKEGKIAQRGDAGRGVFYELNGSNGD